MKKVFIVIGTICSLSSFAQNRNFAEQWNVNVSYTIGLQFFNLNVVKYANDETLRYNMPQTNGFFNYGRFTPTVIQQVEISASVFKNKTWYVGLWRGWGKNVVNSYGYVADANNNTIAEYKGRTEFNTWFTGYFVKKEVTLKRWGVLRPYIGFYPWFYYRSLTDVSVQVKNSSTGDIVNNQDLRGGGGFAGAYRWGVLMLFDSPKIGLEYSVKLYDHLSFTFNYSYWCGRTMLNDFYGANNRFVIPFKNFRNYRPSRYRLGHNDFFSSNVSVGLILTLRK